MRQGQEISASARGRGPERFVERFDGEVLSGLASHALGDLGNSEDLLLLAIHGGSFTSRYFDVPEASLFRLAKMLRLPLIAIDRPGYGDTTKVQGAQTITEQARFLNRTVGKWLDRHAGKQRRIFLIGHSIGGAVALSMGSLVPEWPLLGIAISGVGMQSPPEIVGAWNALPESEFISVPANVKDHLMFGPDWTFEAGSVERSHRAHALAPRTELIDIATGWPKRVHEVLGRVRVPVHYRQAEFDALWLTHEKEIRSFATALTQAPHVDAALWPSAGHCIDFHRVGRAFQLEQIAFAMRCSALAEVNAHKENRSQ